MSTTSKKRGRPPKAVVEARPEPVPYEPVAITVSGMTCPCCGRAMVPKVLSTGDYGKYCRCSLCGNRFRIFLDGSHRKVQPL